MGPELAALLAPFAKWGALVAGVLILVWLVRFWIRQAAKDTQRLETLEETEGERHEATEEYRDELARLHDRWLRRRAERRRLRDREDGSDSAA